MTASLSLAFSPLAKFLLALLLHHTPAGQSLYSFEVMPECGTDPKAPTCQIERVCDGPSPRCAAPRWSPSRNAWVRVETREAAARRYGRASLALARAATWLTRCKDASGSVVEDCKTVNWSTGPRTLAALGLSSSVWESGYREDIMSGHPPAGRGSHGEACVMQIIPKYIESYADWTPDKPLEEMTAEDWAQEVLGDDVQSLERCYRVGLRMLARMHQMARYRCPSAPIYGTYAMYGHGGSSCVGKTAQLGDYAGKRTKSYHAFVAKWPNGAKMPEWAQPIFGFVSSQPANRTIEARRGGDQPSRPGPAVRIVSD